MIRVKERVEVMIKVSIKVKVRVRARVKTNRAAHGQVDLRTCTLPGTECQTSR